MLRWKHLLSGALALTTTACASPSRSTTPAEPPRSSTYPQPFHLFPLLTLSNPLLPETAGLLARTGNEAEKDAAGKRLVQLAEVVASNEWREQQRFTVARLHGAVPPAGLERKILDDLQRRHQVRVFDAMSALGSEPVLAHCKELVDNEDTRHTEKQLAIAVLAAHGRVELRAPPPSTPHVGGGSVATVGRSGATASFAAPPQIRGGQILDSERAVEALRPYFVMCYERTLAQYGRFGAWISLYADVSTQTGEVYAVGGQGDDGVPPAMMQCLYGVMKQAQFAPPRGGNARIGLSLSFTPPASTAPPTAPGS